MERCKHVSQKYYSMAMLRCAMRFLHLNFLNARGSLAQKICNMNAIFRRFSDVINGEQSQQRSVFCQLVTGESQGTGISCPKES